MSKIKIRYNTQDVEGFFPWRVFVDEEQFLASQIKIHGLAKGEKSNENGVTKWNIVCSGYVQWQGSEAVIHSTDKV